MLLLASFPLAADGVGQFRFAQWNGPSLMIHAVEPEAAGPDAPVVFVMHGVRRNAGEYRDNWIGLARKYALRVYVPEFDAERFPGAASYNLGGIESQGPRAFDAIEPLFKWLRDSRGSTASGYVLFGHSAGAQFVHRFTCFARPQHLQLAIAANAGWYTLPDHDQTWPYGLGSIDGSACKVDLWLQQPLMILLGELDRDPRHRYLRRTPEAMQQGPNRLARGHYFLRAGQAAAAALNVPLAWRLETVPGVGHDNSGMAKFAAPKLRAWIRTRSAQLEQ